MKILYNKHSKFSYQVIPEDHVDDNDFDIFNIPLDFDSDRFDEVEEIAEQFLGITGTTYEFSEPDEYMLKPKIKQWLETHVGATGYRHDGVTGRLGFVEAKKVMAFKLKWLQLARCRWVDPDDRKKKNTISPSRRSTG